MLCGRVDAKGHIYVYLHDVRLGSETPVDSYPGVSAGRSASPIEDFSAVP